jgi:hypothetical protein
MAKGHWFMIEFLLSLIPVCLGIWAIHILFQDDHLLEGPGVIITAYVGEKWVKPLFDCPICMSSVWGVIGFFSIRYFFNVDLPMRQIVPFVFCLCGLNTIISKLTSKERVILDE